MAGYLKFGPPAGPFKNQRQCASYVKHHEHQEGEEGSWMRIDNKPSPRTESMVAAAVQWVVRIMMIRPLGHGVLNMTVDDFRQSLTAAKPPAELTLALLGLWWDAKGNWKRAHESAQQDDSKEGSWVHAYLHRKEGDQCNAAYWYGRAGKLVCRDPLDAEWLNIARGLLG